MRLVFILCLWFVAACSGELIPLGPPAGGADGSTSTSLAFRPTIQEDMAGIGCLSASCHGGDSVPMPLIVSPSSDDEWRANYNQVKGRAGNQVSSLLMDKASGAGGHIAPLEVGHPMLARWSDWVAAGAPYEVSSPTRPDGGATDAGATGADATAASGLTWIRDIRPIMQARCTRCHGTSGAYSLESYQGAKGFGTDGVPNVIPGNPLSLLAQYCEQGHEGMPSSDALLVVEWIADWAAVEQ